MKNLSSFNFFLTLRSDAAPHSKRSGFAPTSQFSSNSEGRLQASWVNVCFIAASRIEHWVAGRVMRCGINIADFEDLLATIM